MCKERATPKCCIDNFLLCLCILIFMLLYFYISTNNSGIIAFIIVISIFMLLVFSIRLEECGVPEWIKNLCKNIKVYITGVDENKDNNENENN